MDPPPPFLAKMQTKFNCDATGKSKDGGMDTAQQDLPSEVQESFNCISITSWNGS